MTVDPTSVAAALATGETDRVNDTIERVASHDGSHRFEWYDDLFDACLPVFERDDGYVRQSVVRLLREAYPQLESRAPEDDVRIEETEAQRYRLIEFLLAALEDDDGRVRTAAVTGFDVISTGIEVAGLDAEREALHEALSALAVRQPEEKRKHTERAIRTVGRPGVEELLRALGMGSERP